MLAHELAHVIMNPRRSNGLVETLADAIAFKVLDDLTTLYAMSDLSQDWLSYGPRFREYKESVNTYYLGLCPVAVQKAAVRLVQQ
jgi:Zn-dependent peptidase ImmA (M78 family)